MYILFFGVYFAVFQVFGGVAGQVWPRPSRAEHEHEHEPSRAEPSLTAPRRPCQPPPSPLPGPGAAPVQVKRRLSICGAGNSRVRGPSEPVLPCTRNDYFLQKVHSRLPETTETTTFRHRPSLGEPLENRARASLELTRAGRPNKYCLPCR